MFMKKISFIPLILFGCALFFFARPVQAADQMKTLEYLIATSDSQVSTATDTPFYIYIGDDISGVSNPIKSAHVTLSGTYTGGGQIALEIDSDAASESIYSLPTVANPTPFEIAYKDTGRIDPATAGIYFYTLNIAPSGVTISGLAAKIKISYRFTPVVCDDGSPSSEKIKTLEYYVKDFPAQISTATDTPFSVYIGDNISGVTDPVKSAHFTLAGIYTGGGQLVLEIDSDAASAMSFSLPTVTNPTPFEIIYDDSTAKVNPVSAGTYNYTLNLTPSGLVFSGLGIKFKITHRYKPPACGSGYPPTGQLYSIVLDTTGTSGPAYNSVLWKGALGGPSQNQGKVRLQLSASNSSSGPWSYVGGTTCSSGDWFEAAADTPVEIRCFSQLNNRRYFKYRLQLCSMSDCFSSGFYTPQVDEVVVNWSP